MCSYPSKQKSEGKASCGTFKTWYKTEPMGTMWAQRRKINQGTQYQQVTLPKNSASRNAFRLLLHWLHLSPILITLQPLDVTGHQIYNKPLAVILAYQQFMPNIVTLQTCKKKKKRCLQDHRTSNKCTKPRLRTMDRLMNWTNNLVYIGAPNAFVPNIVWIKRECYAAPLRFFSCIQFKCA